MRSSQTPRTRKLLWVVFAVIVLFLLTPLCPTCCGRLMMEIARLTQLKADVRDLQGRRFEKKELVEKVRSLPLKFETTRYEAFIDYRDPDHWTVKLVPTKRRGYDRFHLDHVDFPDIVIHGPQPSQSDKKDRVAPGDSEGID